MTFYEWAMTRRITNTPRGDFLADMRWDPYAKLVENTKEAWERCLTHRSATEQERIAFRSLWGSYERHLDRNPGLNPSTRRTVTTQTVAFDFA